MTEISPTDMQQWLGELLLEIKIQAKKIKALETEIERLKVNQPEAETKHKTKHKTT